VIFVLFTSANVLIIGSQVKRQFLPRHVNHQNTIFGGEILLWMDRVATYTARKFTGNPNMITISMNRLFFKHPIKPSDILCLT
jgi:acyl-CoA hydrolase